MTAARCSGTITPGIPIGGLVPGDVSIRSATADDVRTSVTSESDKRFFLDHLAHGHGFLLFAVRGDVLVGHVFLRLAEAEEPELRAEARLYLLGHRRVALGVDPDNRAAISLYRELSFAAWGDGTVMTFREEVENGSTVRKPEKCLVFEKRLDPPPPP
jgi:hypothetical protein